MSWQEDSTDSSCPASHPAPAPPVRTAHSQTHHLDLSMAQIHNTQSQITEYLKKTFTVTQRHQLQLRELTIQHPLSHPSKKNPVFKYPADELYSRMDTAEHRLRQPTGGTDESSRNKKDDRCMKDTSRREMNPSNNDERTFPRAAGLSCRQN